MYEGPYFSMSDTPNSIRYIDGLTPVEIDNFKPVNKSDPDGPIAYWDYNLNTLTQKQRTVLTTTVVILLCFSIVGNIATIMVNIQRKRRPLFKICLLSLAMSDILITVFVSTAYISQFSTEMTMIWTLGEMMCSLIPFITTVAILVNSMTLVGIAIDRYMAIIRVIQGTFEPSGIFCITCCVLIWGLAAAISSPMMSAYFIFDIYVIITDPKNRTIPIELRICEICIGEKIDNAYYFGIVFIIVFVPLLIAFVWLNATIAKEIYYRRHPIECTKNNKQQLPPQSDETSIDKNTSDTNTISDENKIKDNSIKFRPKNKTTKARNHRKIRQLRMFKVIIFIIAIFFILRLPTWIYLLIKMNVTLTENIHWILHFSFGILSLVNCVINPFIYTFLSETIAYSSMITKKIGDIFSPSSQCCQSICSHNQNDDDDFKNLSSTSSVIDQQNNDDVIIVNNCRRKSGIYGNSDGKTKGIFSVS